jgi:hypothetical protein
MSERLAGARSRRASIARWTGFSRHKITSVLEESVAGALPFKLFGPRVGGLGLTFFLSPSRPVVNISLNYCVARAALLLNDRKRGYGNVGERLIAPYRLIEISGDRPFPQP